MKWTRLLCVLSTLFLLQSCSKTEVKQGTSQSEPPVQDARPNILLIVADDMGYTDIGAFGGEINTPNLDDIAANGIRLSRFYTSLTCAPTRAMLMSGVDNHRSGLGNMAETLADNQRGLPGYEGYLNRNVASLAELLKDAGYHTYMTGKWHLGLDYDQSPRARGFERSFASLFGAGSHFSDRTGPDAHRNPLLYRSDGELVNNLPEDFYSSKNYTDQMLEYIDSQIDDGKPFFGYLAYTAPHWPLQVPEEIQSKYQGTYDEGYDRLRQQRFEALKDLGLIPKAVELPVRPASVPAWDDLATEEKLVHSRNMEIYAAMVDYMDSSIGRVLSYLKDSGEYDNTLILFISDNGADPWGEQAAPKMITEWIKEFDNSLNNRGRVGSFAMYGEEGALLSTSAFKKYKGSTAEGGIRVPAIISWPTQFESGIIDNQPVSALDVLPTFLEVAEIIHPAISDEESELAIPSGQSIFPLLNKEGKKREFRFGLELWGMQAMIVDDWKLVNMPAPVGTGNWELYNVVEDPTESQNLFASEPERAQQLMTAWNQYVEANNVVLPPWPPIVNEPGELPVR